MPPLQQVVQKTLTVEQERRLCLRLPRADVHLQESPAEQVAIDVHMAGDNVNEARTLLERLHLKVGLQNDTVHIEAAPLSPEEMGTWCALPSPLFRVHLQVPPGCHVDAKTHSGQLIAEGLSGQLILGVNGGSVRAHNLDGDIEVHSNVSDTNLTNIRGARLALHANGGMTSVRDVQTDEAMLRLSNTVANIQRVRSALHLVLNRTSASVSDVRGSVKATSHAGRLALDFDQAVEADLHTVGGSLDLALSETLAAHLHFSAPEVAFDGGPLFTGERSEQYVKGTLNGGHTPIVARAVRGRVRCRLNG